MAAPGSGPASEVILDDHDRRELLRIVRVNLKEWLRYSRKPPGAPHRGSLLTLCGAHVALRIDGAPWGAMTRLEPELPLYSTVAELAIAVATADPAHPPLTLEELSRTRIEIAVLSAPSRIASPPDGIEIGRHGVSVGLGERRGVLLPQRAIDGRWDRETFLAEACRSAGLDVERWRDRSAEVAVFSATVFSEEP